MSGYFSRLPAYCQPAYGFTHNLTHQQWATCFRLSAAETARDYTGPGFPAGLAALAVAVLLARSAWRWRRRRRRWAR